MFPVFVQNQIKEAEEWFKKAKLLDPDDTMVDHHYGKHTHFVKLPFSTVEFH